MNTSIIIQARTGATRLPNKMILPFWNNKSLFEVILLRLKSYKNQIILATTEKKNDDILCNIAKNYGINIFRGSEDNVLLRFIGACENFNVDKIIRVCADNPFLDLDSLDVLVSKANYSDNFDYIAYKVDEKPSIITHYGFWAEATRLRTLKQILRITNKKVYLEHLTNYIYTHPDNFLIEYFDVDSYISSHKDIRLTVDTQKDYDLQKKLFSMIVDKYGFYFKLEDVFEILNKNSEMFMQMQEEITLNEKEYK